MNKLQQNRKLFQMAARIPHGIERKEAPDLAAQIDAIKAEILAKVSGNADEVKAMQRQLDALDVKVAQRSLGDYIPGDDAAVKLRETLQEHEGLSRLLKDKRGSCIVSLTGAEAKMFDRKATITSAAVGASTSGVLTIDRDSGITAEARQELTLRDVLSARPTTAQLIDFVRVTSPMTIASPQLEAAVKAENAVTFATSSERVKTIATWIPASRQVLDDFDELLGFLQTSLAYYVDLACELQMLSADGTGENLHGLIPQATAFNTGLLSATKGWNKLDIIGRAMAQLAIAKELPPSFVVMNPADWADLRLLKNAGGEYLLAAPGEVATPVLFGLKVVSTVNILPGTFLVGSGNPAATEIRDRMEMQIEISTSHSDWFTRNLVAVRGERRLALVTKRPASFITGTFSSSPA